ncbi:hypothetical protein CRG98_047215 [Punica granatum]|uniref:Uncharacterized protein n=1 Tax=Punica granatum TaxID=22663 RepID=A0A2I0HM71_PUNGR|nr:hypothetical protein CRG98_047215 [Punica granatum]
MGRKPYRKTKVSPLPMASISPPSSHGSLSSLIFSSGAKAGGSSSKSKARSFHIKARTDGVSSIGASPSGKTPASVSDLKDFASSSLDDLKRHLDRSHSAILKDFEASHSRLHKRFKMQTQSCQQLMDKVDEECRKISEQINETQNAMKETYTEFMEDVQASSSRLCKTSIPELLKSFEKAIDDIRSRSGIAST